MSYFFRHFIIIQKCYCIMEMFHLHHLHGNHSWRKQFRLNVEISGDLAKQEHSVCFIIVVSVRLCCSQSVPACLNTIADLPFSYFLTDPPQMKSWKPKIPNPNTASSFYFLPAYSKLLHAQNSANVLHK